MTITLHHPWLDWKFGADHRIFGWPLNMPGFSRANRVIWRQLRNADLPPDLEVQPWLAAELAARGAQDAPCFLTSRRIDAYCHRQVQVGEVQVECVATVGLSNAERVGARVDRSGRDWDRDLGASFGTINVAARVTTGLTDAGLIEALSILVQARTVAVMDAGHRLPTGLATGTGTDCALIAARADAPAQDYAGLHTDLGEALGGAVYTAVLQAARDWQATIGTVSEG
jgi:adenosylcobinamide amidohydrolase